jgi:hypothetical protein
LNLLQERSKTIPQTGNNNENALKIRYDEDMQKLRDEIIIMKKA